MKRAYRSGTVFGDCLLGAIRRGSRRTNCTRLMADNKTNNGGYYTLGCIYESLLTEVTFFLPCYFGSHQFSCTLYSYTVPNLKYASSEWRGTRVLLFWGAYSVVLHTFHILLRTGLHSTTSLHSFAHSLQMHSVLYVNQWLEPTSAIGN